MSKQSFAWVTTVLLITAVNLYLWTVIVQGGPAPRAGRIVGLIIMLAVGALFADKFSNNQFAPSFIKAGSIIAMTVLFFILYNR